MRYGLPYKGSKLKRKKKLMDILNIFGLSEIMGAGTFSEKKLKKKNTIYLNIS